MNDRLPDLAAAPWLADAGARRAFALLATVGEARIVGGAVRNALMGEPVGDLDFATTATPDRVVAAAAAEGVKAVPTGIEHGTVTLVIGGRGFEVTTLRQDIETDGRHAVVRFGDDWEADARRRDFTVNALSVDAAGRVYDPVGGFGDIAARRIRFIGNPDQRIAEDRLRLLRLFRFHAAYGAGAVDAAGLAAAMRARQGVRELSAERVGQEVRRLVIAPGAVAALTAMQEAGILPIVLAGIGYLSAFARFVAFAAEAGFETAVAPRIAALAVRVADDVPRVADRLRLANAERDRMAAAVEAARRLAPMPDPHARRVALYRVGAEAFQDGVGLALAHAGSGEAAPWRALARLPETWPVPVFPLSGRDILGAGTRPGPAVGEMLRAVEAWWIEQDFHPDEAALRARLQQLIAAQQ